MPLYYFDFVDSQGRLTDEDGQDLRDADAAYEVARSMAENLLASAHQNLLRCSFEVRDASGNVVFELPFFEVVGVEGPLN